MEYENMSRPDVRRGHEEGPTKLTKLENLQKVVIVKQVSYKTAVGNMKVGC